MNAKEYLSSVRQLELKIKKDLRELEYWKELSSSVSGCDYGPHYNATKNIVPQQMNCMDTIIDLENTIKQDEEALVNLKKEMAKKIYTLGNTDYEYILVLRYLRYKSWTEIADKMEYSIRWIYKLHKKALMDFDEKILKIIKEDSPVH